MRDAYFVHGSVQWRISPFRTIRNNSAPKERHHVRYTRVQYIADHITFLIFSGSLIGSHNTTSARSKANQNAREYEKCALYGVIMVQCTVAPVVGCASVQMSPTSYTSTASVYTPQSAQGLVMSKPRVTNYCPVKHFGPYAGESRLQ